MTVRVAAQVLLGLMLVFGVATLAPRALLYIRAGRTGRGALYLALCVLAALSAAMSFGLAFTVLTE